ncbi:MAG: redox-sensing transcriptional repressor Rex [Bacteroidetes bacterium]|nr:MAG: redox-sensing transcriptional repressor Rex [Bacteroidota bacterium]
MSKQNPDNLNLPEETIQRFRLYQPLLRLWKYKQKHNLTISMISEFLGVPVEKVYEDFSHCPHWSEKSIQDIVEVDALIDCIDVLLGVREFKEALLVGIGKLGTSLLRNETIAGSGLKIVAAFDIDPEKVGKVISGIKVQSMDKLPVFVKQMHLKMAMIASTPENARQAVDQAVDAGISVIWNFTQTHIPERDGLIIQNTIAGLDIDEDYQKILAKM